MIRRPPRSTQSRSSAASDVYKRQDIVGDPDRRFGRLAKGLAVGVEGHGGDLVVTIRAVSYTHLRAHETVLDLVCRLLLEKKKKKNTAVGKQKHSNNRY